MMLIQVVYVVLIWVVPILLAWRAVRKMDEEKRHEVIKEIKSPLFFLGIAPLFFGLLLFLTGSVSATGIKFLQHVGMGLFFFGWCVVWVEELLDKNKSTAKGIGMIAVGIVGVATYIYLYNCDCV
ncbi:hypothetical protein [Sporosarcina sp.]|uniref:hypothetical protein n=1 Tax=Sporosarcina sp. TaxID=49982 RepID=UPI002602E003|nr:hypothetical protein [Sporosarcina sp.]